MLDEPFAALDSFTREELWCVMRDLHAARPVTIILVTHDLREAAFLADRIFCMSARPGRIIAERRVDIPAPAQPGGHLHAPSSPTSSTTCARRSPRRGRPHERRPPARRDGRGALRLHRRLLRPVGGGLPALQDPAVLPARTQRHRPGHDRVLVAAVVPLLPHAVDDGGGVRASPWCSASFSASRSAPRASSTPAPSRCWSASTPSPRSPSCRS